MSGVKGRSGRKSRYQEIQEGHLEKVCTNWLVDNFDTLPIKDQLKVALQIASKMVTQKTEVTQEMKLNIEQGKQDYIDSLIRGVMKN